MLSIANGALCSDASRVHDKDIENMAKGKDFTATRAVKAYLNLQQLSLIVIDLILLGRL